MTMTKDRGKVKASNCERIHQAKGECPIKSTEKHCSLGDELRVHDGPNEAPILPANVCPEANQLDKLVSQTKDDEYEIIAHIEDALLNILRYNCKKGLLLHQYLTI